MGKFSAYDIPLKQSQTTNGLYEYALGNEYFLLVSDDDSEVKRGNVKLSVEVRKVSMSYELQFSLNGTVFVPCNRCLDDMPIEIDTENKLIVKFGKEYSEESDEIVVIPDTEDSINIAWFVYEFIALSVPLKHVHLPGKCNKFMSSKLDKHKAVESNDEDDDSDGSFGDAVIDATPEQDNRWDALKDIKFEDE